MKRHHNELLRMEPSRQIQLLLISVICIAILLLVSTGCKNGEVAPSPTPISTLTATQTPIPTPTPTLTSTLTPNGEGLLNLLNKFKSFPWIAYSPTHYNPDIGMVPTTDDIKEDLYTLSQSGIRGIVTYSSEGILAEIPRLAHEIGFQGVVMGIWTPGNEAEMEAAVQAAQYVDGYVVGNEGLEFSRYDFDTLEKSVYEVRSKTRKPVTTSEPISQYHKEVRLLSLGDWVFPNTHPYWAGITDPVNAVSWTRDTFDDLEVEASKTPVVLKEVGLPTAGKQMLSEYQQAYYYALLRDSGVHFVYFEAFDQPWKSEDGIGSYWGIFHSDRSPKVAANYILKGYPPFYIYADKSAPHNHFVPEGWMGCSLCIDINENYQSNPFSGTSSIRIHYVPKPEYDQKWAGVYWWDPPNSNWCQKSGGFDLDKWRKLTFWVKGEKGGEVAEFKVGGLRNAEGANCDSLQPARTTYPLVLTTEWTKYTISLYGQDLSHIAGGFVWVTDSNQEATIYLDEIRFEWD